MVSRAGHVCAFNLGGGAHSSAEPASLGARLKRAGEGNGRASSNGFWHTLPPATADPNSIPELVTYGCDTFDSCYPTRAGRHGTMLTPDGPLRVVSGGWCVRSGHAVCTGSCALHVSQKSSPSDTSSAGLFSSPVTPVVCT